MESEQFHFTKINGNCSIFLLLDPFMKSDLPIFYFLKDQLPWSPWHRSALFTYFSACSFQFPFRVLLPNPLNKYCCPLEHWTWSIFSVCLSFMASSTLTISKKCLLSFRLCFLIENETPECATSASNSVLLLSED